MITLLVSLLRLTAWPMTPPKPYSAFHLLIVLVGSCLAVLLAGLLGKRAHTAPSARRMLFSCGVLLALMELYKQAFLYWIEFQGHYDWWYFPFQLCSIPMYLCLATPLLRSERALRRSAAFLQDFGLLGAVMALAVPPGLMHPYWTMTLHGFLWHLILLFLGLFCRTAGLSGRNMRDYAEILPFFVLCCLIALAINAAAGPNSDADMFYLSPFHPSSQPVFHEISCAIGILPGNLLYILTVIVGGGLVHRLAAIGRS